jgi:predicted metal-dependent phosphoesterase TrpH
MKFELHCHSWHSKRDNIPVEGLCSPREVARVLHRRGFGGFAIADHDTTVSWKEAKEEAKKLGMVFIPAIEVSSEKGHIIGLGINETVKKGMQAEETIDIIRSQGGLAVAPHPFDLKAEGIGRDFVKCDAAEIFNSLNLSRLENMRARKAVSKAGVSAVGGSDAHTAGMLGLTENIIDAGTLDGALKKIRKGEVKVIGRYAPVPEVVNWVRERMRRSHADVVKYVDRNYPRPKAALSKFMLERFIGSESAVWDALGYLAIGTSVFYSALRTALRY